MFTEYLTQGQIYYEISSVWLLGMWITPTLCKLQEFFTFLFTVVLILAWNSFLIGRHWSAHIWGLLNPLQNSNILCLSSSPPVWYSVLNILAMSVSLNSELCLHNLGGNTLFQFLLGFGNSSQTVNWGNHKVHFFVSLLSGITVLFCHCSISTTRCFIYFNW